MIPFPYKDENPSISRKTVLIGLIAANVFGVFFWTKASYMAYGLVPSDPEAHRWITHLFLHSGMAHLIGNMWFLWIFGDNVEGTLGRGFLPFYLVGGMAATLLYVSLNPDSKIPLIGASGAVSAVMGAYFVLFPEARIRCVIFLIIRPIFFSMSAIVFGLVYIGWQSLMTYLAGAQSGVAYSAHLGGIAFGMIVGSVYRVFDPEEAVEMSGESGVSPQRQETGGAREVIDADIKAKHAPEAVSRYIREVRRNPYFELNAGSQLWVGDCLARAGRPHLAKNALEKFILRHPLGDLTPHAHLLLGCLEEDSFMDFQAAVRSYEGAIAHSRVKPETREDAERRLKSTRKVLEKTFIAEPKAEGSYWILLEGAVAPSRSQWRSISDILGRPADAIQRDLARRPGFIASRLSQGDAARIASMLENVKIPVVVLPEDSIFPLPKGRLMTEISVGSAGAQLSGPHGAAANVSWEAVILIAAAALRTPGMGTGKGAHPLIEILTLDPSITQPIRRFRWTIPPDRWGSVETENHFYDVLQEVVIQARGVPVNRGAQGALRRVIPESAFLDSPAILDAYISWHLHLAILKKKGVYRAWRKEAKA